MRPGESFVGQPVRSLQTMLRVISESDGYLPTVVPDGIYGQSTINAVSAFQRRNGIPMTGITDQQTWDAIAAAYELALISVGKTEPIEIIFDPGEIFQRGETSPYIYLLQAILHSLSDTSPSIDAPPTSGVMDDPTSQALAAFQVLAGLPPTGELDRLTWKYLARHFTLDANRRSKI